jgi:hypothetical protein
VVEFEGDDKDDLKAFNTFIISDSNNNNDNNNAFNSDFNTR